MELTIQRILQQNFPAFAFNNAVSTDMSHAALQIMNCRTAAMGGHINSCPEGHFHQIAYNSCRHRSCPQCAWLPREQWLSQWKERLLVCPHHHCIFTLPHDFNTIWRYNKAEFAEVLRKGVGRPEVAFHGGERRSADLLLPHPRPALATASEFLKPL